jgi:hypothetical protein
VFDYTLQEIISILRTALHSYGYAPQIMIMIEMISKIEFLKDLSSFGMCPPLQLLLHPLIPTQLLLHRLLPLPPQVVSFGYSRVCLLGAVKLISAKICS